MATPRSPERAVAPVRVRVVMRGDCDYPESLTHLHRPPEQLYVLGDLSMLERPVVAIVGTRRATAYGERVAHSLASAYARAGACVISGLARGVDAHAHAGALAVGGATAAVLGTGVDIAYPVGHRALHATIAEKGLLLSEFPPGTGATPGCFPRRNRIIAALARIVVVVEAPEKSGALVTVNHALELGRTIAAVPGAIDSPQSAGSNRLLRDGAHFIASSSDALSLADLGAAPALRNADFTAEELLVWEALGRGALDLDSLATHTSLPAQRCMAAVTSLEIAGFVECELTGAVRRL